MPGPTLDQALEGLTDEQKKMLAGLTPDEVIAARRGPIVTGKIADPSATTTFLPAYGAKGKADDATIPMATEDVGDYGPRTGPEPDAAPTSRPPTGPLAARVRKALAPTPSSTSSGSDPDAVEGPVDLSDKGQGIATSSAVPPPPPPPTRDVEMEKAMQESALRHKIGTIFQLFGIQPSGMDEPLERLAGQRHLQREHLADERQAQLYDPTSRPSRMAQAIAVKRFGWSPADAAQLTASDMGMVQAGFNAEETFKARKATADARRQDAQARLAAEERMNAARIDERRFEAGQRSLDRQAAGQKDKDIPPAVSTQVGASANSAHMIDALDAQHEQALKSGNPADWKRYNDSVETYAPSIAAGLNRTGVARGELVKEVAKNLHSGLFTGAADTIAGTGFIKNKLQGYRAEAASRGREAIDSIGDRYDKSALEAQHARAFPEDGSAGASATGGRATHYRYNRDRTMRIPTDARGNPVGPPEAAQ
jgi:hypothetical protein